MVLENGKALRDARGEILYAAEFFRWYAEEAVRIDGHLSVAPSGANRIMVQRQPVGVSFLITPWNFPAAMATRKIGPALAAGCTVVLKPAKETPLTALAVAAILAEAGVPDGVVNVLPTAKPGPLTEAVLADPRVRKLSFTGSTEVGRMLLKQAADYVHQLLDGARRQRPVPGLRRRRCRRRASRARSSPRCATAARRAPRPTGSTCTRRSPTEFSAKLAARLAALSVGPGLDDGVDLGPLVNADTRTKVAEPGRVARRAPAPRC